MAIVYWLSAYCQIILFSDLSFFCEESDTLLESYSLFWFFVRFKFCYHGNIVDFYTLFWDDSCLLFFCFKHKNAEENEMNFYRTFTMTKLCYV